VTEAEYLYLHNGSGLPMIVVDGRAWEFFDQSGKPGRCQCLTAWQTCSLAKSGPLIRLCLPNLR
jgi:hypothetical protein